VVVRHELDRNEAKSNKRRYRRHYPDNHLPTPPTSMSVEMNRPLFFGSGDQKKRVLARGFSNA